MENLNFEHGYTSRQNLETDVNKVAQIMKEHYDSEVKRTQKESLMDFALMLEEDIKTTNRWDRMKADKLTIIDHLVLKYITEEDEQKQVYEGEIRKVLSRYKGATRNILGSWVKQTRMEMDARRNHIL